MKINSIDRIFKWIYFGFITVLLSYVFYFAAVLLISPKNDVKNRGFVACTKELVMSLGECESGQLTCVLGSFYDDTKCNSAVIFKGFANWLKGKQSAPWSNYIFEPELQNMSEPLYFYDVKENMQQIELDRKFMLEKENELEAIKNKALKVQENVIISDPEVINEPTVEPESETEIEADFEQNIDDESDVGELDDGDKNAQKIEPLPEKKLKSDSEKIAEKAKNEVLKKGE